MFNNTREGSYDRGASTALGGEAVKFILRVLQNVLIEEDDCGSTVTVKMKPSQEDKETYLGNTILVNGSQVLLTEENIDKYVGKDINMRSPLFCKTKRDSFCKVCIGQRYADSPTSLASAGSAVGSTFMALFMAAMHGKALKTNPYDFKIHLS